MDKLSRSYTILQQSQAIKYLECDNIDPLESDSDSNCDLPPFVDLSESSEDDHEAISITGMSTIYILIYTTYREANKLHLVK